MRFDPLILSFLRVALAPRNVSSYSAPPTDVLSRFSSWRRVWSWKVAVADGGQRVAAKLEDLQVLLSALQRSSAQL